MVFCIQIQFYIAHDVGEALGEDKKSFGGLIDVEVKPNFIEKSLDLN